MKRHSRPNVAAGVALAARAKERNLIDRANSYAAGLTCDALNPISRTNRAHCPLSLSRSAFARSAALNSPSFAFPSSVANPVSRAIHAHRPEIIDQRTKPLSAFNVGLPLSL